MVETPLVAVNVSSSIASTAQLQQAANSQLNQASQTQDPSIILQIVSAVARYRIWQTINWFKPVTII